jgi:hypothetical protein
LYYYGIRCKPVQWLESYLKNIKQYVCFDTVKSEISTIVCEIPQGSILGPILVLLYINDLANVSNKLKFILFADDTNVFYSDKCLECQHYTHHTNFITTTDTFYQCLWPTPTNIWEPDQFCYFMTNINVTSMREILKRRQLIIG